VDFGQEEWANATKHTYEISVLKPGDIILSTSPGKESQVIKKFTKSPYSHAMLYADKTIVHADINGVFTTNPQRRLFPDGTSLVLRLRNGNAATGFAACQFALNLAGSSYSIPAAVKSYSLRKTVLQSESSTQFCSRLVAQAYAHAGVPLVKNPDFCFPGDFANTDLLEVVSGATRQAVPAELDLAATPDTVRIHQDHTYAWLRPLCDLIEDAGFARPDNIADALQSIIAHPQFDADACQLLIASEYLTDYNLDRIPNPHRYDLRAFESILLARPREAAHILATEYDIAADIMRQALSQYPQYDKVQLRSFRLLADMHRNRLIQSEGRIHDIHVLATRFNHTPLALKSASSLAGVRTFLTANQPRQ